MSDQTIKSTNCCESFNPEPWQDKEIIWQDKLFVKDHVTSFLHMPLNMGKVVSKNCELIDKAAAATPSVLLLSDEKSLWGADIYIEVTKNVPGAQMVTLSGKFLTKVFLRLISILIVLYLVIIPFNPILNNNESFIFLISFISAPSISLTILFIIS